LRIIRVPLIHDVIGLLVAVDDEARLHEIRAPVSASQILPTRCLPDIDRALADLKLARRLRASVAERPGVKVGTLKRERQGASYCLFIPRRVR
jgi:hypothetical protein